MTKQIFDKNGPVQYLTSREVAERLGVTLTTIQNYCNSHVLPYSTTRGGHRRIAMADIVKYEYDAGYPITKKKNLYDYFQYEVKAQTSSGLIEVAYVFQPNRIYAARYDIIMAIRADDQKYLSVLHERFTAPVHNERPHSPWVDFFPGMFNVTNMTIGGKNTARQYVELEKNIYQFTSKEDIVYWHITTTNEDFDLKKFLDIYLFA